MACGISITCCWTIWQLSIVRSSSTRSDKPVNRHDHGPDKPSLKTASELLHPFGLSIGGVSKIRDLSYGHDESAAYFSITVS